MPNLIATKSFSSRGRRLKKGDPFKVNLQTARVLIAIGKAKADLTPPAQTYHAAVMTPQPAQSFEVDSPEQAARPRRQYRRRDLNADK